MNSIITILAIVISLMMSGCQQGDKQITPDKTIMAENDSVLILSEVIVPAEDELFEFNIPIVAIWIKNKKTQQETKLYQTVRPTTYVWYNCDRTKFFPVSLDSIPATEKVTIIQDDPLQIIVEGWSSWWEESSYIIDVSSRKTLYVPSSAGYLGTTKSEGYMIFKSAGCIYFPEGGKEYYTILDIYDRDGNQIDSYSLKPLLVEKLKKGNQDLSPGNLK